MIEIKDVSKRFGSKIALDCVSFTLNEGEVAALIGENGAGKSTLMRILCGYLDALTGTVHVYGNNIEKERLSALKYIGYVPEISSLYGDMKVYDFLLWIANIWNISDVETAIVTVAKQMQIIDVFNQRIETLSKGYRKRVEIASAILHQPKFLILDEPTDGLDPNQKRDIRQFIKQYAKNHIVLVSTHVLEDIDVADRVIMLANGKIIKDSSMSDFKKASKNNNLDEAFRILSQQK